ncbi:receptor activity-modifying protein 1 isoform X3 [Mus caroli]|uniref:Receptor activity-modifying protein 1 n=1 Tax=Mus caroli TaxID=10089 RepID=A0A6P5PYV4_MUSCR|nr:receptor activity-modifying protein 1 isoform X3 [Mus caroli]
MAPGLRGLPRCGLWLLLAYHLFMVTACQDPDYGTLIQELCLSRFKENMETIGKKLWCDWGKTIGDLHAHSHSVLGLPRCDLVLSRLPPNSHHRISLASAWGDA